MPEDVIHQISWDFARLDPEPVAFSGSESTAPGTSTCLWVQGFIANRRDLSLRLGLADQGSDADLLVGLYERFGLRTPIYIAGPFSWVLWDSRDQRLVAVRDRLGIYSLYYTVVGTRIKLASSISRHQYPTPPILNEHAIAAQIQGQAPPPGETFFSNIQALEPGCTLSICRKQLMIDQYWKIAPQSILKLKTDFAYAEAFSALFSQIIREYKTSELAGVTLSGGMDSTTVAASLRREWPDAKLTAFSWISPGLPEADESREITAVARALGFLLSTIPADQYWCLRTEPGIRTTPASPFFNYYHDLWDITFQTARASGVYELHSGLGGDHLFGGEVFSYPDLFLVGRWGQLLTNLKSHLPHSNLDASRLIRRTVFSPVARQLLPSLQRWKTMPPAWLGPRLRDLSEKTAPKEWCLLPGRRARLKTMADPLLPVVAQAVTGQAARHGVEFRHPLLDHRLCELAASLPTTQTYQAGMRKIILRNAMRNLLPDQVVNRRHKVYPKTIAERGLREREQAKVWALMTNMVAAEMGFVDEARLRLEYQHYLDRKVGSALFWHTITLESWLRQYFT
jgi:asparagine synthase (glutamine-hydrolysing)